MTIRINYKAKVFLIAILAIVIFCALFSLRFYLKAEEPERMGLYSWKSSVFEDRGKSLFSFMKQYGFTEVYQYFSSRLDNSTIAPFLRNAEAQGISVYMLSGEPDWATDLSGEEALQQVTQAVKINQSCRRGGLKGIMFDIEPYLLNEWDTSADSIMKGFVEVMACVYQETAKQNLESVLCIPYFYDSMGFETDLEALIQTGCTRVAVMNYYKKEEVKRIESEVAYAKKYGKGLINIYEFQAPGRYELKEENTYYYDGFEAAAQNFASLKAIYPDSDIMLAAHNYEALKEVLTSNEYSFEAREKVPDYLISVLFIFSSFKEHTFYGQTQSRRWISDPFFVF